MNTMNTSSSQPVIISLIVIILCCLVATAKAEPRQACSTATAAKKAPAPQPEPKKVEKPSRPAIAVLPAHKEFQLTSINIPTNVKVRGNNDEHFVIKTEAGTDSPVEIRTAGLIEGHVVPGSLHYRD